MPTVMYVKLVLHSTIKVFEFVSYILIYFAFKIYYVTAKDDSMNTNNRNIGGPKGKDQYSSHTTVV